MDNSPRILYYPNFNLNDLDGIKHALLLYDRVCVIGPTQTPSHALPTTPADLVDGEPGKIKPYPSDGALAGLGDECLLEDGSAAVEVIDDYQIASARADEFLSALREDLDDPDVAAWEATVRRRKPDRRYAWYISAGYFQNNLGLDVGDRNVRARYRLGTVVEPQLGELIEAPLAVGMSLGLSEALWAAADRDLSPFTLDPASAEFLLLRLRRGWRALTADANAPLRRNLDIDLKKRFATTGLRDWALGFSVPDLFEDIPGMRLSEVIALRRRADTGRALADFYEGTTQIVLESGLWRAKDFEAFRAQAEHEADTRLGPAWEALHRKPFEARDLVTAVDTSKAAGQFIAGIPKLFVSSTAAAAGGAVALTGGLSLAPAALFALGCGLAGSTVARLLDGWRERREAKRNARFMSYLAGLKGEADRT